MPVSKADFTNLIDWVGSSTPIWKHVVLAALWRRLPDGSTDAQYNFGGPMTYSPGDAVFKEGFYGTLSTTPGRFDPVPPLVIVGIALTEPVGLTLMFQGGRRPPANLMLVAGIEKQIPDPNVLDLLFQDNQPGNIVLSLFTSIKGPQIDVPVDVLVVERFPGIAA